MAYPLQTTLPYNPFAETRLPGIAPLAPKDWLIVDDAFGPQMVVRDQLIAEKRPDVIAQDSANEAALQELLDLVVSELRQNPDYQIGAGHIQRPDGVRVVLDPSDPLATLGRLIQEDLCLLEKRGEQHVLTAAVLCFLASWRLAEKIGRPLIDIHVPVAAYTEDLAKRVQRLFDGIKPDRSLWRFNCLWYDDPQLHQPRSAAEPRPGQDANQGDFLRSERQCLIRLPKSNAVVFSIHSFVLASQDAQKLINR